MKSIDDVQIEKSAAGAWRSPPVGAPDLLGVELQAMFGSLTQGPLPDRMVQLVDALEEAFRRGELFDSDPSRLV